jgi:hypothetical protein
LKSAYVQGRDENVQRNVLVLQSLGFEAPPSYSRTPEEHLTSEEDEDPDYNPVLE